VKDFRPHYLIKITVALSLRTKKSYREHPKDKLRLKIAVAIGPVHGQMCERSAIHDRTLHRSINVAMTELLA
jgi:hypothetical protein